METEQLTDSRLEDNTNFNNEQTNQNEEHPGQILTSSTCHNLICYNDNQENESNKENKLFKNKSESDLVVNKNKLNKIYLPAEDTMDMEQSFKESTGKKYSSSWFYGDSSKNPYPTIEEQVKLCRKIASQLVDDENRKSNYKRLKNSTKWVHEGNTKNDQQTNNLTADEEVEKLKRNLKLEAMPKLKLILDPRELLSLEKLKKTGDIVEHNIVSPDVCHDLVKDLQSPEINKGAAIFLKRKEKSRDWIVDENSTVEQVREKKREQELKKQEENVQKEWLMKKQKEQEEAASLIDANLPIFDLNAGHQPKTLYIQTKQPQNAINNKLKFEDNCSNVPSNQSIKHNLASNQFLQLNFKNFNRGCRGWGVPTEQYVLEQQKLQQTPELRLNLSFPVDQPFSQTAINQSMIRPINQSKVSGSNLSSTNFDSNILNSQSTNNSSLINPSIQSYSEQFKSYQPLVSSKQYPIIKQNLSTKNQPNSVAINRPQSHQTFKQSNLVNNAKTITPSRMLNNSNYKPNNQLNYNNHNSYHNANAYSKPIAQSTIARIEPKQPIYVSHACEHHLNRTNNYNSYVFEKPTVNLVTHATNDHPNQSPAIGYIPANNRQSNVGNLYHISNGLSYADNPIKHFDLTKLQIPHTVSLHNFKDFNARPKMFVKC